MTSQNQVKKIVSELHCTLYFFRQLKKKEFLTDNVFLFFFNLSINKHYETPHIFLI